MDADWTPVTIVKTAKQKTAGMSTAQAIGSMKASGAIATEKKFAAGSNKTGQTGDSLRKLDDSTDEFKHNLVDRSLSMAIAQARQAKKLTQKQLAQAINESAQVIQSYECGKAIPDPQVLVKLDRALGIHLPRVKKH